MSLPLEKVQELKQIIHSHLSQMNVHSRIKEYVDESFRGDDPESSGIDEAGLLDALKERGIVDDVMNTLKFEGLEREPRRSKDKRRTDAVEEIPTRGNTMLKFTHISDDIILSRLVALCKQTTAFPSQILQYTRNRLVNFPF